MDIQIRSETGESPEGLRGRVEAYRERTLGRLARRIRRAALTLEQRTRHDGTVDHLCELEVDTGRGKPLRLRFRRRDPDEVLKATFQRARAELIRRARGMRRPVMAPLARSPLTA